MIISKQNTEIVFYWADAGGGAPDPSRFTKSFEEAVLGFGSTQQAVLFLRRYPELFSFRQLLNQRYTGQSQTYRLEDLYNRLAADMVRKRLRVVKRWLPAEGSQSTIGAATVVPRREVVERSEPAEPPTFLPNNNNDAQAETLAGAASDGEPFCEECEKARLQAEASTAIPEPETPSFPPDHDGDSQAKTLIDAAKDGVPFCEECEKARLKDKTKRPLPPIPPPKPKAVDPPPPTPVVEAQKVPRPLPPTPQPKPKPEPLPQPVVEEPPKRVPRPLPPTPQPKPKPEPPPPEVKPWTLEITLESTTAFGWPKEAVTVDFPGSSIASQSITMTAKTGKTTVTGTDAVDSKGVASPPTDWTAVAEAPVKLQPGGNAAITIQLKGADLSFVFLDAATPPAPVAKVKTTILREDGTPVPGAPTETDDKGLVELKNVPPEKYTIKFPELYDAEWDFSKTEAL